MPDRTRFNDAARGYEHPVRPLADGAQFSREDLDMLRSLEKGREAELRAKQQEQEARKAQDRAHFMKLVSREEAKAAPKLVPKWAADLLNRHQIAAEAERRRQHANKRALKVIERKYA
ncbi:MAG: hypothetical protein SV201_09700, partial [Pseudomonadota bacterium]|nr:hypothetical protein [Pseudomonadota bacterium]